MSGEFTFHAGRQGRIGLPEAIFCASKSAGQIEEIVGSLDGTVERLLLTRLEPGTFEGLGPALRRRLDYDPISRTAILGTLPAPDRPARVALVTAGTSDSRVAAEAARTLLFHGEPSARFQDIGVAGLWRLLRVRSELARFPIVIACAGMEGALFSVLGGLVPGLVVAVPVAVGYGVTEGGRAALTSALGSCAPGIVTVNIDKGYGAACAALRGLGPRQSL